ncbi:T9SS type A sorting domain-containing protein [Aquimarina brevivitae]|uniref:Putative secreted protein (Por secretion system target) n=1 Tax=Aquimarina brevivitae TaxID=323412 RepID=A0A4Q7P0Z8_9FLAO|nr:T9SS type A sorting domain-containing protein [Aquimarina brevivitae]RZS93486.1 putative secreted protein (Por secretion system target) [Aquimarina brevivitae]
MKKLVLLFSILCFFSFSNDNDNDKIIYEIEPTLTSDWIMIKTYPEKQVVNVKIMDLSGFLRIEKEVHMDKKIDVTSLPNGTYIVKISSDQHAQIAQFVKGGDAVTVR